MIADQTPIFKKIEEELNEYFSELNTLKTIFETQVEALHMCAQKHITDQTAYNILTLSLEGLVIKITRLTESLIDFFNVAQAQALSMFSTASSNQYLKEKRSSDRYEHSLLKPGFIEARERLFPNYKNWSNGKPSHSDFEFLKKRILSSSENIKAYRDSEIAHKDKDKEVILEVEYVTNYFKEIEQIFTDIYLHVFLSTRTFKIGGLTTDTSETAKKIAALCANIS